MQRKIQEMSFRVYVLSLLCIFGLRNSVKGLILSPSEEVVICVGEELELICTTNATFLRWSWSLQIEQGEVHKYSRFISSTDVSQQRSSVSVNSTLFLSSRVSHQGRLPLVSRLLINPISLKVNAVTEANCTELQTESDVMASITINMVGDINAYYPNLPEVNSSVVEYRILDVIVLLQWTPQNGVIYNISTNPRVAMVDLMITPSVQFSVSYNTLYNVSIVATSICGQNRTVVSLHYAACDYPLQEGNNNVNYSRPALEGTSIMFDCPPGLEFAGSESATCMENGEWEPNITCSRPICGPPLDESASSVLVMGYNDVVLEGDSVNFTCSSGLVLTGPNSSTCMENGNWEPDPSRSACQNNHQNNAISSNSNPPLSEAGKIAIASVSVFLVTFALAFTAGIIVIGHCCCKQKRSSEPTILSPLYDTIHHQPGHSKQDVAMSENIAYSIVQPTIARAN